MRATGRATLLVDHYDDDWSQLWWVRVRGRAEVHDDGAVRDAAVEALAAKYPQYVEHPPAGAVWRVALDELRWWRGSIQRVRRATISSSSISPVGTKPLAR